MKKLCVILCLLLLTAAVLPVSAEAKKKPDDNSPGMEFVCERSEDGATYTVTAYLLNPEDQINAGMFVLQYDGKLLSTSPDRLYPGSDDIITSSATTYYNPKKFYIGVDWYPASSIEPSDEKTAIAKIDFDTDPDISDKKLAKALSLCEDEEYLDELGGYGDDGGVLLCTDSTTFFGSKPGTARVILGPEKSGVGIAGVIIPIAAILAVIIISRLILKAVSKKNKRPEAPAIDSGE